MVVSAFQVFANRLFPRLGAYWSKLFEQLVGCHLHSLAFRVFDNFNKKSKRKIGLRFGMNEKDRRPSRAFARRFVDELKSRRFHGVERVLCVLYAESNVGKTASAAVPLDRLLHGRIGAQWLEQLNQVRPAAHIQQHFTHLVASKHVFAMNHVKAQHRVGFYLAFQLALPYSNCHVIDKFNSRYLYQLITNAAHKLPFFKPATKKRGGYSTSISTWCAFTGSPGATCTLFTRPV